MANRFDIVVKYQGVPGGGSSGRGSGQGSSAAAQLEREAKRAEAAAKKVADTQAREAKRAAAAISALAQLRERESNRIGTIQARAAKKAADDSIREAKRAADAEIREAQRAATARARLAQRVSRAGSTIVGGAVGAARGVGAAASAGVGSIASGGLLNVASTVPRAVGDLAGEGLKAAGSLVGAIGKGVGQLLPGALSFVPNLIGGVFKVAGELAGALTSAAGEIAGFIGDKLGLALKVSLGAAVGVAVVGIREALKRENVAPAFEQLAAKSGDTIASGLEKAREATRGLVSDTELMTQANRASALGAAATVEDFGKLADVALRLGKNVGVDAAFALESLTLGIGRLSPKIIDNIGLNVSLEESYEKYAASVGKLAKDLTTTEQRQAILNETFKQADEKLSGLDRNALSTGERITQVVVSLKNAAGNIGGALIPALTSVLNAIKPIADAIGRFFENNNKEIAESISKAVEKIGVGLADLPALISNIKLEEVFSLATEAAEELWIRFVSGAKGALEYVGLQMKKFALENAAVLGFATGGIEGAAFGAGIQAAAAADSASEKIDRQARNVRFTPAPGSPEAQRLDQIQGRRIVIGEQLGNRAATLPAASPRQASPTLTLGSQGAFFGGGAARTGTLGGSHGGIPPEVQSALTAINSFADVLRTGAGGLLRAKEAQLEEFKRVYDLEREYSRLKKEEVAALKDLAQHEIEQRREINDKFAKQIADIKTETEKSNTERTRGVTEGLVGDVGGLGPDASAIPAKLRRAAAKVRRQANRERRDSLNAITAGQSVDELAANGGAGLKSALEQQAGKETAGANAQAVTDAKQKIEELQKEQQAALDALTAQTVEAFNAIIQTTKDGIALHQEEAAKLKEHADTIEKLDDDIKKLQKQVADIPGAPRR